MEFLLIYPGSVAFWGVMLLNVVLLWLLARWAKGKSQTQCRQALAKLCVVALVFFAAYKFMLFLLPNYPFSIWDELPLQPCNFSLLCLLVGCLCDQKLLLRWSHCFGVPFALLAMLLPLESFTNISVFSPLSLGFYGHHTMVIVLCASVFFFQLVEVRYAHIMQMLGSTICVTVLCHLFNICLRNTVYPEANYFYTFGLAGNVLLETAKQYIPYDLFYLAPFLLVCLLWCAGVALLEQTILPKLGGKLALAAKFV